jgi:hypothetical protein
VTVAWCTSYSHPGRCNDGYEHKAILAAGQSIKINSRESFNPHSNYGNSPQTESGKLYELTALACPGNDAVFEADMGALPNSHWYFACK